MKWLRDGLFAWVTPPQRGELYGTLESDLLGFLQSRKIGIFPVVPESALEIKRRFPELVFVFFLDVDEETRRKRIAADPSRSESSETAEKGLEETRRWRTFVQDNQIADVFLSNSGKLSETVDNMLEIIRSFSD